MLPALPLAITPYAILPWFLLALGVILVMVGWHGKRIGDHWHCRQCDFDLTGLPEAAAACPECGADLLAPRAKVRGQHTRRRRMIVFALVFLLIGGTLAAQQRLSVNYARYTPSMLLLVLIEDDQARQELADRIGDGRLVGSVAAGAVNRALDVQGNLARPWDDSWGMIIEQAGVAGLLSDQQLLRYAEQAGTFSLKTRPKLQIGRRLAAYVGGDNIKRLGPKSKIDVTIQGRRLTVNGEEFPLDSIHRDKLAHSNWSMTDGGSSSYHLPLKSPQGRLGVVTVKLDIQPLYTVITATRISPPIQGATRTVTASTEVVDHPTGNYLDPDAVPLADRAANAWVWIAKDRTTGELHLTFGVRQAQYMFEPNIWLRVGDNWVKPKDPAYTNAWGGDELGGFFYYTSLSLAKLRKQFPTATHMDLLARTNIELTEVSPGNATSPNWLGQWIFRGIPLDAAPQDTRLDYGSQSPISLAPAEAQNLTLAQAEQPPTSEPTAKDR